MLTAEGKRSLRAQAHHLKPVVLIGQHGVTDAVIAEIGIALDAHELIKIEHYLSRESGKCWLPLLGRRSKRTADFC